MGYIIPSGYSRVTVEMGAISPLGSQIVFGFGVNLNPSEALLDAVEAWVDDNYVLNLSNAYSVKRIEARNDTSVIDRVLSAAGLVAGEAQPPSVAALMRLTTGLVGRKYRGRIYIPGVLTDDGVEEGGQINTTLRAALDSMMANLSLTLSTLEGNLVILHSDVGEPTLVTGGGVQGVAATQRRRLRA